MFRTVPRNDPSTPPVSFSHATRRGRKFSKSIKSFRVACTHTPFPFHVSAQRFVRLLLMIINVLFNFAPPAVKSVNVCVCVTDGTDKKASTHTQKHTHGGTPFSSETGRNGGIGLTGPIALNSSAVVKLSNEFWERVLAVFGWYKLILIKAAAFTVARWENSSLERPHKRHWRIVSVDH